jgi:DNA-binding response OmpR family regulator
MPKKILVVDDEPKIAEICQDYLKAAGYEVVTAMTGPEGIAAARREKPDLVVLDLMLPEMDGLDVCRTLRRESDVPIIMLTARVEETDKLIGLEIGADDYITKPFSPRELVARVRAVLRRAEAGAERRAGVLRLGALTLDDAGHAAVLAGDALPLSPTEYRLLRALAGAPGRVFSRRELVERALLPGSGAEERVIDSHVKNLRQKLARATGPPPPPTRGARLAPPRIRTVFGVGYKLVDPARDP